MSAGRMRSKRVSPRSNPVGPRGGEVAAQSCSETAYPMMNSPRWFILAGVLILLALFFYFDLHQLLTLENMQRQRGVLLDYYRQNALITLLVYALVYISVTGLSLPGAGVMTLIAGAIFDLKVGVVLVSFSSTFGASIAFLLARYLFRDLVQRKFSAALRPINRGVEREGAFYLFALRLVPAFPFFAINLAMALTPLRLWTFYWVSQVGMFAGTMVYVNAGSQLGQLESLGGILSPALIGSFALLGLFPLIAKRMLDMARKKLGRHT